MGIDADLDRILEDLADEINLEAPAPGGSLGAEVLDIAAVGIAERSLKEQVAPDQSPWADNEPRYAARKGGLPVGVLTGDMLSLVQLEGERDISPRKATARYGVTQEARDKAEWFTTGRDGLNAERPFYDLDPEIESAMFARVDEAVGEFLSRLNSGL